MPGPALSTHVATPDRWDDVVTVFGDCAEGRKCWCAYWYLPNSDYRAGQGAANRAALEVQVSDGLEPGILAYVDTAPAGWMSVAPRRRFDRLNRSRSLAPVDDEPAWAINCFIVRKKFRRRGLVRELIRAGIDHVRRRGGTVIEAYPVDAGRKLTGYDLYLGTIGAFRDFGFEEVARRLPTRPIMRLRL